MTPWIERPTLELDLGLPPRERYRAVSPEALEEVRQLFDGIQREFTAGLEPMAEMVRQSTRGRFDAEMQAAGELLGLDWRAVAAANASYDLALATLGCSTMALATSDGPVLARNMDWWPEDLLARATYNVAYHDRGKPRFQVCGWPGAVGVVTGLSSRGFAVALNAVLGPEPSNAAGYPVLLLLRQVLEDAVDFEQALQILTRTRIAASALFILVGTENAQRVVIERSPSRHAVRWGENDRPLLATNDYRRLFATSAGEGNELLRTTCTRYEALLRATTGLAPISSIQDEHLLYILSDPQVLQTITAQHAICRPTDGILRAFIPRRFVA